MMSITNKFTQRAKEEIVKLEKEGYNREVFPGDIEVVFQSYVLGYMKATFVVARNTEGRYYEVSLNTKAKKLFIDVYKKDADIVTKF
jgi:hypothetical protein